MRDARTAGHAAANMVSPRTQAATVAYVSGSKPGPAEQKLFNQPAAPESRHQAED
jgi:hypothetical protein